MPSQLLWGLVRALSEILLKATIVVIVMLVKNVTALFVRDKHLAATFSFLWFLLNYILESKHLLFSTSMQP